VATRDIYGSQQQGCQRRLQLEGCSNCAFKKGPKMITDTGESEKVVAYQLLTRTPTLLTEASPGVPVPSMTVLGHFLSNSFQLRIHQLSIYPAILGLCSKLLIVLLNEAK
jgi:hypothetical protein